VVRVAKQVLELSAMARERRRLQAKAEALAAMGLAEAERAVRSAIHRIDEDRQLLLGLCDALRAAASAHPAAVKRALQSVDASGTLLLLVSKAG
jgi:hypothetical protein